MEHTAKHLGETCNAKPSYYSAKAIKKVFEEGIHPRLGEALDYPPERYWYNEDLHGPSRRTTEVRKLVRKQLAKIEPWEEEDVPWGQFVIPGSFLTAPGPENSPQRPKP